MGHPHPDSLVSPPPADVPPAGASTRLDASLPAAAGEGGWAGLEAEIVACRRCPRLVAWREEVARVKVRRHALETYWGRPLPGFGDPRARLLLVGLAPAAHGGNRTGRLFTGDRSGDWLFRALFRAGFANQPTSVSADDGLRLDDCFVSPAVRCAPPGNKPLPGEFANCRPFLLRELGFLSEVRVVIGLGRIGFDAAFDSLVAAGLVAPGTRPRFAHGARFRLPVLRSAATAPPDPSVASSPADAPLTTSGRRGGPDETHLVAGAPAHAASPRDRMWLNLLGTYHPSQQNTFTGRLTEEMFDAVFVQARALLAR